MMNDAGSEMSTFSLADLQAGETVPAGTHTIDIDGDEAALTALYEALVAHDPPEGGYAPDDPAVTIGGYTFMCSEDSKENCTLDIDVDANTITTTGIILVV